MTTPLSESLEGRRALVTGGTKGTGAAIARRLAQAGATVLVTARSRPDDIEEKTFITADLSTAQGAAHVAAEVDARVGGVDILVNTLGGSEAPAGGFAALGEDDWAGQRNTTKLWHAYGACGQAAVCCPSTLLPVPRSRLAEASTASRQTPPSG
ncbi:SDR family NAD(P)-dependent oxidoreductase [Streptomyces sp. NBC_00987]|uniref:SDR family NAD(P)-dependent oxidoreductase n=1 Tax=Streptomyces sp. NBC_00987 TaxID=2903703 RepID=UPI00386D1853